MSYVTTYCGARRGRSRIDLDDRHVRPVGIKVIRGASKKARPEARVHARAGRAPRRGRAGEGHVRSGDRARARRPVRTRSPAWGLEKTGRDQKDLVANLPRRLEAAQRDGGAALANPPMPKGTARCPSGRP